MSLPVLLVSAILNCWSVPLNKEPGLKQTSSAIQCCCTNTILCNKIWVCGCVCALVSITKQDKRQINRLTGLDFPSTGERKETLNSREVLLFLFWATPSTSFFFFSLSLFYHRVQNLSAANSKFFGSVWIADTLCKHTPTHLQQDNNQQISQYALYGGFLCVWVLAIKHNTACWPQPQIISFSSHSSGLQYMLARFWCFLHTRPCLHSVNSFKMPPQPDSRCTGRETPEFKCCTWVH